MELPFFNPKIDEEQGGLLPNGMKLLFLLSLLDRKRNWIKKELGSSSELVEVKDESRATKMNILIDWIV